MTGSLLGQLDFHVQAHLFPRLEGLADEEYFWEPAPDRWSVVEGPGGWGCSGQLPSPTRRR